MHFQLAFEPCGQHFNGAARFRRPDQIDGVRRRAADGGGPGRATVAVGQHLDLVDHGHVDRRAGIEHLDRAGDVGAARRDAPFLDTTLPPSAWRPKAQPCPLCGGAMEEAERSGRRVFACVHHPLCEGVREL